MSKKGPRAAWPKNKATPINIDPGVPIDEAFRLMMQYIEKLETRVKSLEEAYMEIVLLGNKD